jgi:4-hydroxy-3-methylbut-2-enyl diphosphate reductase
MLAGESLAIAERMRQALLARYGAEDIDNRFRAFDTICSATQDRQDAVLALLDQQRLDLMLVLGGYNSSNTFNLARICAARLPTFHVADPTALISAAEILHKPVDASGEMTATSWLPDGPLTVGLTSGASTPDNLVGAVIRRLDELANG